MARPLRIEYPGALYHVTSRGNKRNEIFSDDRDRHLFFHTLKSTIKKHNWLCHSFCLMDNHYHLLPETPDENLSSGMRDLNGVYTQTFNKRHKTVGHLLQGRFKAFVIEKETYLLQVARYIVLNPVRAGLVKYPEDWPWSSYRATAGLEPVPPYLNVDWILNWFSNDRREAQLRYRKFVMKGIQADSPFHDVREGIVLGSLQFLHELSELSADQSQVLDIPRSERKIGRPSVEELFSGTGDHLAERNQAIIFSRACGYSNVEIAKYLGVSHSLVSLIARGKKGKGKR